MAHILVVDDHAAVRAGLRQFLLDDPAVKRVDDAESAQQCMEALRRSRYDLLVLDINMPGRNGLDILRNVISAHPETKVLIVSGYPERQYAVNVLKAGASGYISKESAPEELQKAVHTVLAGRRYVSATLAEQLVSGLDIDNEKPIHSTLSEREFQIFCKLATGKAVSDIAPGAVPERQDGEHLSQQGAREDELCFQRRHHHLCAPQRPHAMRPAPARRTATTP